MSNLSLITARNSHYELLTLSGYLSECFTNPLLHHITQAVCKTGFRCVLRDRLDEAVESQHILLSFKCILFIYLKAGYCI